VNVLLVSAGGVLGALARWSFGSFGVVGTFAVNLSGCLLIGIVAARTAGRVRLFLGTGVLGGYTTFSAYSVDAVQLSSDGRYGLALAYVLATLLGALAATVVGLRLGRALAGRRQ
jgi:CrcB protein